MSLFNPDLLNRFLSLEWSESHGALPKTGPSEYWRGSYPNGTWGKTLGGGLLYYFLTFMSRAKICVCIGSGGGFVPSIMRQAQKENNIDDSITILIDANVKNDTEWDRQFGPQWVKKLDHPFNFHYPEVKKIIKFSDEAIDDIDFEIDYLHIDGDHSYEQVKKDFKNYSKKVKKSGFITLHDAAEYSPCGVRKYLNELKKLNEYNVIIFEDKVQVNDFTGIALVTYK